MKLANANRPGFNSTLHIGIVLCLLVASCTVGLLAQTLGRAGHLDSSFGSGGVFTTNPGLNYGATSVALQSTGKIIIGGTVNGLGALLRVNSNGTLDTSFGSGGVVTNSFGIDGPTVVGLVVQPDDKILAYAVGLPVYTVLGRFNSDGSLDTSFGGGGFAPRLAPCQPSFAAALRLQANGEILVGCGFRLARYTSTGSLDSTFGNNGVAFLKVAGPGVNAIAVQSDGRILVAVNDIGGEAMVSRYNSDGRVDTSYGILGQAGSVATSNAMALQSDGRAVIAGTLVITPYVTTSGFGLIRYNTDGSIDTNFGSRGGLATGFSGLSTATAFATVLQSNGNVIAAGQAYNQQSSSEFALARYTSAGSLDPIFGAGGRVLTRFGSNAGSIAAMVLQPDSKIVVAGSVGGTFAVARYFSQ